MCVAIKEFNDELLNLETIQDKLEKVYPINEQQVAEMDELYDEIWKFYEPIKNLEILLAKKQSWTQLCWRRNRVNRSSKRKKLQNKSRIRM